MKTNLKIKAKTKLDREVTIIAFVCKFDHETYAVTIDERGRLFDYAIKDLTVIDTIEEGVNHGKNA